MKREKTDEKDAVGIDYQTMLFRSPFLVDLQAPPSYDTLSDAKKQLIQTLWNEEGKRKGRTLHEERILSAISYDNKTLVCQFVSSKYFLAQKCDPSLKSDLKIVPVSLNGLTSIADNLLLAKRADWVAEYPDRYELVPSGCVRPSADSTIDLKQGLFQRLLDEVGIDRSYIKTVKFFALLRDLKTDAIELCAEIKVKPFAIFSSSSKYSQVMTIASSEIQAFAHKHAAEFVPLSLKLLKLKKWIQ
jgi:isopentenyldiphosphate isomerase